MGELVEIKRPNFLGVAEGAEVQRERVLDPG